MPVAARPFFALLVVALVALPSGVVALATASAAAPPTVVASIPPVHALVALVMAGIGRPRLLMAGGASPHAYALKPSDAHAVAAAAAVFWIGPELERFLIKPLAALAGGVRVVPLARADGVRLLKARKVGVWADDGHDHGSADDYDEGDIDPHLWLDPRNAAAMVRAIVTTLADIDPGNAGRYRNNGNDALAALGALEAEVAATLAPVKRLPYVVFHDAYQYFERRFNLVSAGAIAVGSGRAPGPRRVTELRQTIIARKARCVFTEPQFRPALAKTLIEGTGARLGVLDPLGAGLVPDPGLYAALMRGLAWSLLDCLKAAPG